MKLKITLLILANIILFILNIYFGSAQIPFADVTDILFNPSNHDEALSFIILKLRIPSAVTAVLSGASLSVCGLILQSFFRNPLAGPSILGITSGANLAVAICILGFGVYSGLTLSLCALIGAMVILLLLIALGRIIKGYTILLIVGILISYLVNALTTLLGYYASSDIAQSILIWGMGNFNNVGSDNLFFFTTVVILGLLMTIFLIKPLNGWMLGEYYASNMGISIIKTQTLSLFITGLLTAVTTAYCGPIAFIGLSMPHLARFLTKTDNHRVLIPFSALFGSLCTSFCLFISTLPSDGTVLPVNSLTPIFGIPVIIYVIIRNSTFARNLRKLCQ